MKNCEDCAFHVTTKRGVEEVSGCGRRVVGKQPNGEPMYRRAAIERADSGLMGNNPCGRDAIHFQPKGNGE